VQGQERTLTFEVADLQDLIAWNLYLAYDPLKFAPPALQLAFGAPIPFGGDADVGSPVSVDPIDFPHALPNEIPAEFHEIVVSALYLSAVPANGPLMTASFSAIGLGQTDVFWSFMHALDATGDEVTTGSKLSTNISAIPEAETWAMMLTGLGLVGFYAARRRNTRA
jgi:hypothetical protein